MWCLALLLWLRMHNPPHFMNFHDVAVCGSVKFQHVSASRARRARHIDWIYSSLSAFLLNLVDIGSKMVQGVRLHLFALVSCYYLASRHHQILSLQLSSCLMTQVFILIYFWVGGLWLGQTKLGSIWWIADKMLQFMILPFRRITDGFCSLLYVQWRCRSQSSIFPAACLLIFFSFISCRLLVRRMYMPGGHE